MSLSAPIHLKSGCEAFRSVTPESASPAMALKSANDPSFAFPVFSSRRGSDHRHDSSLEGFGQSRPGINDCGEVGIYLTSVGGH